MKSFLSRFAVCAMLIAFISVLCPDANAASKNMKAKQIAQTLRQIAKLEKKLHRTLLRLPATERAKVLALQPKTLEDSDNDGVSDELEDAQGSNACDIDTDDDGANDDEELNDGTDPEDSDSDDDGVSDGDETEADD